MAYDNASIQIPPTDAADEPLDQFEKVHPVNLRRIYASIKHELHHMRDQDSGAIVNCSSHSQAPEPADRSRRQRGREAQRRRRRP